MAGRARHACSGGSGAGQRWQEWISRRRPAFIALVRVQQSCEAINAARNAHPLHVALAFAAQLRAAIRSARDAFEQQVAFTLDIALQLSAHGADPHAHNANPHDPQPQPQ